MKYKAVKHPHKDLIIVTGDGVEVRFFKLESLSYGYWDSVARFERDGTFDTSRYTPTIQKILHKDFTGRDK